MSIIIPGKVHIHPASIDRAGAADPGGRVRPLLPKSKERSLAPPLTCLSHEPIVLVNYDNSGAIQLVMALFRLDTSSGVPFYRQIIDQVLLAVADGRLKAGVQLPTVRQLAVDLSVNLNTVAKAYREMEIRGIVETQQGTGTFIAARRPDPKAREKRRAVGDLTDRLIANGEALGIGIDDLIEALMERAEAARRRDK